MKLQGLALRYRLFYEHLSVKAISGEKNQKDVFTSPMVTDIQILLWFIKKNFELENILKSINLNRWSTVETCVTVTILFWSLLLENLSLHVLFGKKKKLLRTAGPLEIVAVSREF